VTGRSGVLATLLALAACGGGQHGQVPVELQGRWATTDARFAGRGFELGAERITFLTGAGQRSEHAIEGVRETLEERGRQFEVAYAGDKGVTLRFVFFVDPDHSRIRIRYQEDIAWERVEAVSVP
jgi:hypothetical protein